MSYILAIDQSTSGTKAVVFTGQGRLVAREDVPHRQIVNDAGWVEHDPMEIYRNVLASVEKCLRLHSIDPKELRALGISNQRETVVCWDRATGEPVYHAIVWQCGRAAAIAERLSAHAGTIRQRTGLSHSPYFSAPKLTWILENVPRARELQAQGRLCCGTVDAWLVYKLTGGKSFKTDLSNASRTELLDLDALDWDDGLLGIFGLDRASMPQVVPCDGDFGETDLEGLLPSPIPIAAVMGDSHAALYANRCVERGSAKATFGTGTSVMMNAGTRRFGDIPRGVVECVAWAGQGKVYYALEGNINYSGALIQWLKNNLGLIESSKESGILASQVDSAGGVYLVPAFSGLGAPHWVDDARAILCGMTTATRREHVVRAAEEAIAYQIRDITEQFAAGGLPLTGLCVDGGATRDRFLMSFVCDMLAVPLMISRTEELSAAGAAYLAALSAGVSSEEEIFRAVDHQEQRPAMDEQTRQALYRGWKNAVAMLTRKDQ